LHQPLLIASDLILLLAAAGCGYLLLAGATISGFLRRFDRPPAAAAPPVTLLKPLHGDEPGLEAALRSFLAQDYPGEVQVVFGVRNPADPARVVAERLQAIHGPQAVTVVVDPRTHGSNGKVGNLINMAPHARHEILVLSDSDITAPPDYLRRVVAALEPAEVGIVTCPYYGVGRVGLWSRLAAMGLTYQFLPSVAVGVSLGMAQPCMGSTIALSRTMLTQIGGFESIADQLADDYALGAAVRGQGLQSRIAPVLVAHGCAETSLGGIVAHELRWARTIRIVDPGGFFGSGVTHAIPLGLIALALSGGAAPAWVGLAVAAACRLWMMRRVEKIAPPVPGAWWLFPVRDILSFAVFAGSFFRRVVDWRGERFRVDVGGDIARS
jgi:ceramide glucosyltransferase